MRYDLPERVIRELFSFATKHSVRKIILFGSRARGNNTERSDVDIFLDKPRLIIKLVRTTFSDTFPET